MSDDQLPSSARKTKPAPLTPVGLSRKPSAATTLLAPSTKVACTFSDVGSVWVPVVPSVGFGVIWLPLLPSTGAVRSTFSVIVAVGPHRLLSSRKWT